MSLDSKFNQPINQDHYDCIADAWQYLLGTNFHWGYFKSEQETLEEATDNLIELLVQPLNGKTVSKVLDVGCGIGGPATFLAKKFGWQITGFSTSAEGIARAKQLAADSMVADKLQFDLRDALDNRYLNQSFDAVILLEMSHLINDKAKLIEESIRTLKTGGTITLCDLTIQRRLTAGEIVANYKSIQILEGSFGKARLETLIHYERIFKLCGLENVQVTDVSQQVIPTIGNWRQNAERNFELLTQYVSEADVQDFIKSCDILERFYRNQMWGYGLISGTKTSAAAIPTLTSADINQALF